MEINTIRGEIIDTLFLKDGRVFIKMKDNEGRIIGGSASSDYQEILFKEDGFVQDTDIDFKLLKANQSSESAIKAKQNYAALIGDANNRIMSAKERGNFIVGPVTFTANLEEMRFNQVFRLNGLHASVMPSTIITPIPLLAFDFPAQGTLKRLTEIAAEFTTLFAGLSI